MRASVAIALAVLLLGAGTFLWMRSEGREPAPPPAAEATVEPVEPLRSSGRRAILPLRTESAVPAAPGVEVRWANLNREAIAALDGGDLEKAVELFDQCRVAVPQEPVFARNQAEALARLAVREDESGNAAERAGAIEHLARAAELAPERTDIARRLEQMRRLAQSEEGFAVETSEHFELSYDGARTDLLWSSFEIVKTLEIAYQDLGELFGQWPVEGGRPRIRVVLYKKSGFHEATGMGHWAAGVFDGSVRVPVEDLGREKSTLERVLRHEIGHAFVREAGGNQVPGWLNEGLAQWLESRDPVERAREIEDARARLTGKTLIPLDKLEGSLSEIQGDEAVSLAYAESLALCGWITATSASASSSTWSRRRRRRTDGAISSATARASRSTPGSRRSRAEPNKTNGRVRSAAVRAGSERSGAHVTDPAGAASAAAPDRVGREAGAKRLGAVAVHLSVADQEDDRLDDPECEQDQSWRMDIVELR